MAGRPLRPATRRRLGRPLPHQQADRPRAHPRPRNLSPTTRCLEWSYPVLDPVSRAYPRVRGRLLTCYSPVRRSSTPKGLSARLACVKHAASVRPEPGSNSPTKSLEKRSWQQKCCQRNLPPTSKGWPGYCHNWHWLFKHPVEFSKNNRTPSNRSASAARPPGHSLYFTRRFRFVKSRFRNLNSPHEIMWAPHKSARSATVRSR